MNLFLFPMVEMLLSQTFVGPSPSSLILSYLKHAVMSEVRTTPALQLINFEEKSKESKNFYSNWAHFYCISKF